MDFKDTDGGVRHNHRVLAAYAMIVEEHFARAATVAFVYLVPTKQLVAVSIGANEREEVTRAVVEMRRVIEREDIPGPTPVRARCVACEFRNYCADIW